MRKSTRLLLLDTHQVERLFDFEAALQATREAFVLQSEGSGRVFPLVREKLADGVFGIKSGGVASLDLLGFKAAGSWPGNRALGGDSHQATIMLFDPSTGRPRCLIDGNLVSGRTFHDHGKYMGAWMKMLRAEREKQSAK